MNHVDVGIKEMGIAPAKRIQESKGTLKIFSEGEGRQVFAGDQLPELVRYITDAMSDEQCKDLVGYLNETRGEN